MGKMSSPSSPHTPGSRRSRASSGLSLDLSAIPPLIVPAPPSNTLLITNLDHPLIFSPQNLDTIRREIHSHAPGLHSFSPLKSLRRIIATFTDIPSAQAVKAQLDGIDMMGCRVRVYFGVMTDVSPTRTTHLAAPAAAKLFFISPPPSPPHGWEMRNEEPPNQNVHAEDLAHALAKLNAKAPAPVSPVESERVEVKVVQRSNSGSNGGNGRRSRSATLVYHPEHHGSSPLLPAISVEDTTEDEYLVESPVEASSPMEDVVKTTPILHTARPPVELMEH